MAAAASPRPPNIGIFAIVTVPLVRLRRRPLREGEEPPDTTDSLSVRLRVRPRDTQVFAPVGSPSATPLPSASKPPSGRIDVGEVEAVEIATASSR